MQQAFCSGQNRTAFFRAVAHRNHIVKELPREFIDVLGPMMRDIDAQFAHGFNGGRVQSGWSSPGAFGFKAGGDQTQKRLRHLATRRVSGTKKKNASFHVTASGGNQLVEITVGKKWVFFSDYTDARALVTFDPEKTEVDLLVKAVEAASNPLSAYKASVLEKK